MMKDEAYEFEGTLMEFRCPEWLALIGRGVLEFLAWMLIVGAGYALTVMYMAWMGTL
jgi:hypothetical protein